jgi:4-hydroxyacetophenone monooxygenase
MPVLPTGLADCGFRILIIGCGAAGICAAVALRAAGITYTVIEKNVEIGGTWLENIYPGCGVDMPSHLYSYSFAPNPDWLRYFAKRDEIADYLRRVVADNDVTDTVLFDTGVTRADYREDVQMWEVLEQRRRAKIDCAPPTPSSPPWRC